MQSRNLASSALIPALALGVSACVTVPAPQDPAGLAGTVWAVEAVNRDSVLGRSDFTVAFTGSTFDARFGCRRATGSYTIRYGASGDTRPVFAGYGARIAGTACTGKIAEQLGPELMGNASFSLDRQPDGRLMLAQPPTFILLRSRQR